MTRGFSRNSKPALATSEKCRADHIAGAFDYLIAVDVPDMDAYHEFISHKLAAMDNIGTVQSSFVMSEVLER